MKIIDIFNGISNSAAMAKLHSAHPDITSLAHIFYPPIDLCTLQDSATYFSRCPLDIIKYCVVPYVQATNWTTPRWVGDLVFYGTFEPMEMEIIRNGSILVSDGGSIFRLLDPRTKCSRYMCNYPYIFSPSFHYDINLDTLYLEITDGGDLGWVEVTNFSSQLSFRSFQRCNKPLISPPSIPADICSVNDEILACQVFNDHLIYLTDTSNNDNYDNYDNYDDSPTIKIYRCGA